MLYTNIRIAAQHEIACCAEINGSNVPISACKCIIRIAILALRQMFYFCSFFLFCSLNVNMAISLEMFIVKKKQCKTWHIPLTANTSKCFTNNYIRSTNSSMYNLFNHISTLSRFGGVHTIFKHCWFERICSSAFLIR